MHVGWVCMLDTCWMYIHPSLHKKGRIKATLFGGGLEDLGKMGEIIAYRIHLQP